MERGRHVNVTLHREPPAAAEDKQSVSMVLAVVKEGEEEVGVRISIFQVRHLLTVALYSPRRRFVQLFALVACPNAGAISVQASAA